MYGKQLLKKVFDYLGLSAESFNLPPDLRNEEPSEVIDYSLDALLREISHAV